MKKNRTVNLGSVEVGEDCPTLIVAELSANHGGDLGRACELIHAVAEAGADAIKLQTYTPDTMTLDSDKKYFKITQGPWAGRRLYDLYHEAHTPWGWHEKLFEEAKKAGLLCFSSPFDATAVDFLEAFNPPCYKLASFELVDIPLIKKIASTGRPVIFSTGMASLAEIDQAISTFHAHQSYDLIGLRCVSAYPADPSSFRLQTIPHLSQTFGIPAGLSDHSLGSTIAIAAVALGAALVEKHVTLRRSDGGPDAEFSAEPKELAEMVAAIRATEKATAVLGYGSGLEESENLIFRRSIFAVEDIQVGELFTAKNIRVIRPGNGLSPAYYDEVLSMTAAQQISAGTPLNWGLVGS